MLVRINGKVIACTHSFKFLRVLKPSIIIKDIRLAL